MNPAAILSLISELYAQVSAAQQENQALREQVAQRPEAGGLVLTEGDIHVYAVAGGFVVADSGGWIDSVFDSSEAALAAARGRPQRPC